MIDVEYHVQCDGDDSDAGPCEAEFYLYCFGSTGNVAKLRRQLRLRGWRVVPGPRPVRVTCPLHEEPR